MAVHIHEFLYRGQPENSGEPPAWHLTLVSAGANDFGEVVRSEKTLNMAQAAEAGWGLPEVIAAINSELMAELDGKREEIAGLKAKLAEGERTIAADAASTDAATNPSGTR